MTNFREIDYILFRRINQDMTHPLTQQKKGKEKERNIVIFAQYKWKYQRDVAKKRLLLKLQLEIEEFSLE